MMTRWRYVHLPHVDWCSMMPANTHGELAAIAKVMEAGKVDAAYIYETEGDALAMLEEDTPENWAEFDRLTDVARATGQAVFSNGKVVEVNNVLDEEHPEIHEIEDALEEAYKGCTTGRERVGVDARAIRAAMEAWLNEVESVTRDAQAMLITLENWSKGRELPACARDLVDAVSGRGGRDSIPYDVSGCLIWHLALEAATYEHPDLQHRIDLEGIETRPLLGDWKAQIAREMAKRSAIGFDPEINIDELNSRERMLAAFVAAVKDCNPLSEREAAE